MPFLSLFIEITMLSISYMDREDKHSPDFRGAFRLGGRETKTHNTIMELRKLGLGSDVSGRLRRGMT